MLVEPLDGEPGRFVSRLAVDAVVRDPGDHDVALGLARPLVRSFRVAPIVEQLLVLCCDEQQRTLHLRNVVDRGIDEKFLADWTTLETADLPRSRRRIVQLTARPARGI